MLLKVCIYEPVLLSCFVFYLFPLWLLYLQSARSVIKLTDTGAIQVYIIIIIIIILLQSWRRSTKKQYNSYITKWVQYCRIRKINPLQPSVETILKLLTQLYEKGLHYSAINTAKCAVISLDLQVASSESLGKHPPIARFLKGVFQAKPSLPRHSTIWDVGVVFKLLRKWPPAKCLSRKQISLKMAMLLLLLSAERGHPFWVSWLLKKIKLFVMLLN